MHYHRLGHSDLQVSEVSLGSWLTYGLGVEAQVAWRCLDAAFDAGINYIDTGNITGATETFHYRPKTDRSCRTVSPALKPTPGLRSNCEAWIIMVPNCRVVGSPACN